MSTQLDTHGTDTTRDAMPLLGLDHIELWVGNAKQAAHYFVNAYGFREVAAAGLETGVRDRASHVVQHGNVRLVLTASLRGDGPVAAHVAAHGDGVRSLALAVPDAAAAYRTALDRGATLDGARAVAMLLWAAPKAEARLEEVRELLQETPCAAGASSWNALLVVRLAAQDGQALLAALVPLINLLTGRPVPRVWQC